MMSLTASHPRKSLALSLAMLAAGGALMFYGRRSRLAGRIAASLGAAMTGHALTGPLGLLTGRRLRSRNQERLDMELDDSFPASDPPSSTPMVGAVAG